LPGNRSQTGEMSRNAIDGLLMTPLVSLIIVNWNGLAHLPDCLDSLTRQTFRDFEVILVDNGSVDGSVPMVVERYPWVKVVPLKENTGFASGNNHGFTHAQGRYIVTLNNDTWTDPEWLKVLVDVAGSHSRIGMVASRICSAADPDLIDSMGMVICSDGMSRGRFRNRRWSKMKLMSAEVEKILLPSACAALYRREMVEQIGFFDDDFFAYAEDTDLGLRGRLAGWDAILANGAVVYHKYSQSSGSLSAFKVYLVERNHYWVVYKNFPMGCLLLLPLFTLLRYLEQVRSVLLGSGVGDEFRTCGSRWKLVKSLGKGMFDNLRGLPGMLRKRRQVMENRQMSTREFSRLIRRHHLSLSELLDNGKT
jgi:GT2 family glycosyltransferase